MSEKSSSDKAMNSMFKNQGSDKMDQNNKELLEVAKTGTVTQFIKTAFTDKETGRRLSYAEMRSRYC